MLNEVERNLRITFLNSNDSIFVENFFSPEYIDNDYFLSIIINPVQKIEFHDGTSWNHVDAWNAYLVCTEGNDTKLGSWNGDHIYAGGGDDVVDGDRGNDEIYGENGDDTLNGGFGDDMISGGPGNDSLDGYYGNDYIDGGPGDDLIEDENGTNVFIGGLGDDVIRVTGRNNIFIFSAGDGHDIIDSEPSRLNESIINFGKDITPQSVYFVRAEKDLLIKFLDKDDQLTVISFFPDFEDNGTPLPISLIRFEDGTEWTVFDVYAKYLTGTDEDDTKTGTWADDIAYGGGGNDVITGEEGEDEIYGGDGNDSLTGEEGKDQIHGGDGDDTIDGGADKDLLYGDAGNDIIIDNIGANTIFGGEGDDTIESVGGVSYLIGGPGDDIIKGGPHFNRYFFAVGDGHDTIAALNYNNPLSTLQFEEGITREQIYLEKAENDLLVKFTANDDQITLKEFFTDLESSSDWYGIIDTLYFKENASYWSRYEILQEFSD